MTQLAERLILARKERKLSQAELAVALSASQSTVATWERGRNEPDLGTIERIAATLDRTPEWLAFGIHAQFTNELVLIPEIDVRATSGGFGMVEVGERDDAVIRRYGLPRKDFRNLFGADPAGVVMLEIRGDSMSPTLSAGEHVLVDNSDRSPSPPGIFVVFDGLGMVLKRVEFIAHSEPPSVRISSDNPHYEPYTRTLEEAFIQGRVVAHWLRT